MRMLLDTYSRFFKFLIFRVIAVWFMLCSIGMLCLNFVAYVVHKKPILNQDGNELDLLTQIVTLIVPIAFFLLGYGLFKLKNKFDKSSNENIT